MNGAGAAALPRRHCPDEQWTWLLTQGLVMRDERSQAVGLNDDWTEPVQFDHFLAGIDEWAQGASLSRIQPSPG